MRLLYFFSLLILTSTTLFSQTQENILNLDLESIDNETTLPDTWYKWGTYKIFTDSTNVQSGKYSAKIISDYKDSFGCIIQSIPAKYKGKKITLTGYIKTKDITDGYAGLIMRIDDKNKFIEFDNMNDRGITGTNDWQQFSITLPLSKKDEMIYFGGILDGFGTAWFDNFSVSIDGKDITALKAYQKEEFKADLDTEYDNGSMISIENYDSIKVDRLYKLGKIWGFLKYYHPEIAKGNLNWDYELFRILPSIESASFEEDILNWIRNVGELNSKNRKFAFDDIAIEPTTKWIHDKYFISEKITIELERIRLTKPNKSHYYISLRNGVKNPIFQNEDSYKTMSWDDDGFKILSLFRYWNMIEYYFPYKHLIDKNWDEVLFEYIPKFIRAETELDYKLETLSLIREVQDTHANIWMNDAILDEFHGQFIPPLKAQIVEGKPIVSKIFDKIDSSSKISVGDEIIRVDGHDVNDLIYEKSQYTTASNEPTMMRNIARNLLRTNGNYLSFTFKGKNGIKTEWLKTYTANEVGYYTDNTRSYKFISDSIGYIYPGKLERNEINKIMPLMMNTKGIIIDFRCYPSDFVVFSLSKYLNPKKVEFVKFTRPNITVPGLYSFTNTKTVGYKNKDYYKGKVIILINEQTQSSAEYHTMALRVSPTATVIGSTTAGADGNVSEIYLPGGIRTLISGIGVYYPDGTETQRIGIVPDIEVKPTIQAITYGRDELMEKALEVINSK